MSTLLQMLNLFWDRFRLSHIKVPPKIGGLTTLYQIDYIKAACLKIVDDIKPDATAFSEARRQGKPGYAVQIRSRDGDGNLTIWQVFVSDEEARIEHNRKPAHR